MKKVIALITAMLTVVPSVYAQVNEPYLDITTDTVTVSGTIPSGKENRFVNVFIMNPDKTQKDISEDGAVHACISAMTEKDGYFEVSSVINSDSVQEGNLLILVSGDDFENPEQKSIWFSSSELRKKALDDINASTTEAELSNKLTQYADTLSYNTELFKAVNKYKVAGMLLEEIKKEKLDENTISEKILMPCIVEGFNEGLNNLLIENNELKYKDILKFEDIDKDYSCNASDIYNSASDTGKQTIINKLFSNTFKSIEDIRKQYIINSVIYAIPYSSKDGYGHVDGIITSASAKIAGLDSTKYDKSSQSNKDKVAIEMLKNKTYTISAYQKIMDTDYSNQQSGSGGNGGGGGGGDRSNKGNTTVNIPSLIENKNDEQASKFSDLSGYDWAMEAINHLYDNGIINGMENGKFEPEGLLTRAQLAKMISVALKLNINSNSSFNDVDDTQWYYPYVSAISNEDIMIGNNENMFNPQSYVTRQDIAVVIKRAANINTSTDKLFADDESISDYAKDAVYALCASGIINGFDDNTFRPVDGCTRAQAAKIIYNGLYKNN